MGVLKIVEGRIFDKFADWESIDKEKALSNARVLDLVREACLIEAFFVVYVGKMIDLFWYDIEATSMFTIEGFEAYTHYYTLRRYLETVGYKPVTDQDVQEIRKKDKDKVYDDEIKELVNFMATEHFAACFFRDLSDMSDETILKNLLMRLSGEEVIHSQFASDLLKKKLDKEPLLKGRIITLSKDFKHIGLYALPFISNVKEDNLHHIQQFNKKVEKLVGEKISDYLGGN